MLCKVKKNKKIRESQSLLQTNIVNNNATKIDLVLMKGTNIMLSIY